MSKDETLLPVTQEATIEFLNYAFRNIDMPELFPADLADIASGLERFARSQFHSLPGDAPVTLSEGFEAEQDGDTFTIRFPDGHAITARADGRLAITKAFSGYFPFEVNVAALTPSPCPGDVGMREALAAEISRKIARVHPTHHASSIPVTIKISRTYAEMQALVAALTPSALSGDGGEGE